MMIKIYHLKTFRMKLCKILWRCPPHLFPILRLLLFAIDFTYNQSLKYIYNHFISFWHTHTHTIVHESDSYSIFFFFVLSLNPKTYPIIIVILWMCVCVCVVYALNRQYLFENLNMIITTNEKLKYYFFRVRMGEIFN